MIDEGLTLALFFSVKPKFMFWYAIMESLNLLALKKYIFL